MIALAVHTFRECFRRAFPYAAFASILALAAASKLFLAFSFGAEDAEAHDLVVSAVFLTGFALATFHGTAIVRGDIERGTLALILTKPVSVGTYLLGRMTGLFAASATLCAAMACAAGLVAQASWAQLLPASGRALLATLVLDGASLAVSAAAPRIVGPVLLVALFLAGSLAGASPVGLLLPNFAVFGLEADARPPLPLLTAYAAVFSSAFLLAAYIFLASKAPLRSQS